MAEDAGTEAAGEMGDDGHVGQAALPDSVHHSHMGAQEASIADTDGSEDADLFGADDSNF